MEELTLFDFDFSNERKSVEDLKESFRTLQEWHKEKGLPYFVNRRNVPSSVRCDIEQFFDQGWIVNEREGKFNFAEECLLYHTTDELITLYQKKMDMELLHLSGQKN
ncbi:hypothetical protein [Pseudobacillus badius]|uniref:hypothetical protein n=1 Tax=Bacillus badius TaxID=1455 RepID=UPI001CBD1FF8|nr:hypothetical protein [Bacillus badius]UAT32389.1 hypothetical protein K7T73_09345 [Bacillus badius]GLY12606.1 hypothetical protein Bbad01_38220 [Bacillus badius]